MALGLGLSQNFGLEWSPVIGNEFRVVQLALGKQLGGGGELTKIFPRPPDAKKCPLLDHMKAHSVT